MLKISRQRVHQLRQEHRGFPAPAVEHPRGQFYKRTAIVRWGRKHGYIDQEG